MIGKTIMGVVVGFLILIFGLWGIADVFRGYGLSTLARIGSTEIPIEQFRQVFNDRLQQIRMAGQSITPQQAHDIGLDRQILGQLMGFAALDQEARSLGLGISDDALRERIRQDPSFRGANGQFDPATFQARIMQQGYNESRFVAEQRRVALRKQIFDTVTAGIVVPTTTTQAIDRYQNEQRDIDYFVLSAAQAGPIEAPTEDALRQYYDAHKAVFRAPEFRKLTVLAVTPEKLAQRITISDDEARQAYDQRRDRFGTPERRDVQQIVFPNEEEARQAVARLGQDFTFEALAKERGMSETDFDLGLMTKKDIVDPAVADAAFNAAPEAVVGPIKGRFGFSLVRVTKIEPAAQRDFDSVKDELKKDLANERARSQLNDLRDKIDDEIAGGSTLAEAAGKLNLDYSIIDAVDRAGHDPDNRPVKGLPANVDLLPRAFASQVGIENDPVAIKSGGFVYYAVDSITPSRERSFDEAKSQVEARWSDDLVAKRLADKAKEATDKIKAGSPLATVAQQNGVAVQNAKALKRNGGSSLPAPLVVNAFRLAKGDVDSGPGQAATEQVVFQVSNIVLPPVDPLMAKNIETVVKRQMEQELFEAYLEKLRQKLGSSINQSALTQAVGASD
jgi:peptidyl-prolyl cis-trans isomerase D